MIKNNKKTLYVLIPAVLMVWGLIGYRLVGALGEEELNVPEQILAPRIVKVDRDTNRYVLNLDYPNPFKAEQRNKTVKTSKPGTVNKSKAKVNKVTVRKAPVRWPSIIYQGEISREGQALCLLSINSKIQFVEPGEEINGLKLLAAYPDSVYLEFQKEKKYFKK